MKAIRQKLRNALAALRREGYYTRNATLIIGALEAAGLDVEWNGEPVDPPTTPSMEQCDMGAVKQAMLEEHEKRAARWAYKRAREEIRKQLHWEQGKPVTREEVEAILKERGLDRPPRGDPVSV